MANFRFSIASCLLLLAALSSGAAAQSSGGDNDCTNVVVSMSPCLNYGNSSAAPSAACCTQLATVARSRPQCLCDVIGGAGSSTLGLSVDQSQALALPKSCNVQTPDSSKCQGSGSKSGPSSPGNGGGATGGANSIKIKSVYTPIFLLFTLYYNVFIFSRG